MSDNEELSAVPESRVQVWAKLVMHQQELVTSAQVSYDSACTIRLEKKHKLKEEEDKLAELVRGGPDGLPKPDPQMKLDLGDDDDELDGDSELEDLSITDRQRRILAAAGIETLDDFVSLYDGDNDDYPNGPQDIAGLNPQDVTELNRAYHEYNEDEVGDTKATLQYEAPIQKSTKKASVPVAAVEKVNIRFKAEVDGFEVDQEAEAERHPDGSIIVTLADGGSIAVTSDEVEVLSLVSSV